MWRFEVGWSPLDITCMVTKQLSEWGIRIYFDPSDGVNFVPASMINYWEVRFTFTITFSPLTYTSLPVGTASNTPVTYFISFEGYTGLRPSSAIISDVETRGDLDLSSEFIDLKASVLLHFKSFAIKC